MVAQAKARDEKVETERVQVLTPVDMLEQIKQLAAIRKTSMSALFVEWARAGLNSSMGVQQPVAPVVVEGPSAEEIATAVVQRLEPLFTTQAKAHPLPQHTAVGATPPIGQAPATVVARLEAIDARLTLVHRETLTHSEMLIDDIAARYITATHGTAHAKALDIAEDAYAAAKAKAVEEMRVAR